MHVRMRAHDAATGVVIRAQHEMTHFVGDDVAERDWEIRGAPGIVAMRSQKIDARPLGWCAWPKTPSLRPSNEIFLSAISRDSSRMLRWSALF